MSESQAFSAKQDQASVQIAEYYGVSVDNYFASLGQVGLVGFDIGQSGLAMTADDKRRFVPPDRLFHNVYGTGVASDSYRVEGERKTFPISDQVLDYCQDRNISPLAVIRMGNNLLAHVNLLGGRPGVDVRLHRMKDQRTLGKLDSRLKISISQINMIQVERTRSRRSF